MRVVVTGSHGFVGAHLTRRLSELGFDTVPLDMRDGHDLCNWENVRRMAPFDAMIHLAARTFIPESYERPRDFYHTNVVSTLHALELCRLHGARMILASSYVYGEPQRLPIDESHPVVALNPYAQSKIMAEDLCRGYHRDFDLPVMILRPFNIYGAGQQQNLLIGSILKQVHNGRIVLKDSRPKRDLLHISDLVAAYVSALNYQTKSLETFNIGFGESHSIKCIAETIAAACGGDIEVSFTGERRKREILDTVADITKAETELGWKPRIPFEQGIASLCLQVFETAGTAPAQAAWI